MKWIALLAVAAFLLAVESASAASRAVRGTVVAEHARSGTIVLARRNGVAVTVRVSPRRVRLGDRVRVAGKRLRVLSHVQEARLRGVVVKQLARGLRVASGHSILTIHTGGRRLSSDDRALRVGSVVELELEIEDEGLTLRVHLEDDGHHGGGDDGPGHH